MAGLRARGGNVLAVAESEELRGKGDERIYEAAVQTESALLVTADAHFQDDRRFPLHGGPGILVLVGGSAQALGRPTTGRSTSSVRRDMDPNVLPWNKYTASPHKLRCRGREDPGDLFDDEVIWDIRYRPAPAPDEAAEHV